MTTRQISYRLKADGKAELQRDARDVGDALQDAGDRGAAAFERTGRMLQNTGELTERQITSYKKLAAAAREAERAEEAQRKINGALGVGSGTGLRPSDFMSADEIAGSRMSRGQRAARLNLARQGADVFTTAAMGMDPAMIAIQQGPQVIDALAQAGIKATPVIVGVGAAVAGVGAAVIAAAAAQNAYEKSILQLDVAARGLGASSGMTADQINAQAMAAAEAGEVSAKAAREMAAEYASTGRIGGQVLGDLVSLTRDYAATTRQDASAATKELGAAFSDPAKGAADLNAKLNFLSVAEEQHIQNLARSGREAEAQALLVDRLRNAVISASDATTGWGHAFQGLGDAASNAFDKVGRYIDRLITGGSDAEKLTRARQGLAQANLMLSFDPNNNVAKANRAKFEAEINEARKSFVQDMDRLRDASLNQRDRDRQGIVDRYADPKRKALRDKRNDLAAYLSKGGESGDATARAIQADIDALNKGYASAADMASKLEAAHKRAVRSGETADRKREADARKAERDAEEAIRMDGLRADHAVDNQRRIAQARGDESTLDLLERQGRLQDEINRYLREGFNLTQATANARAQISAEMGAEAEARSKDLSNPVGFVSANDRIAGVLKDADIRPFKAMDEYVERLRLSTRSAFEDGLMSGIMSGNFWEAFRDRLKYAAADALARSFATDLFGSAEPGGKTGKIVSLVSKLFPKFANGTNYAPGGLSLVGEYGPEIVDLPRGAQVHTSAATRAMFQGMANSAANASAGETVNFHYSPTYQLQGTSEEIRAMRAEIDRDRKAFKANAVAAYADAKKRRQID